MITFEVNGEEFTEQLNLIIQRLEKIPQALWKDIGDLLIQSIEENFWQEGRPTAWIPSKRVVRFGGFTMTKTGDLMKSPVINAIADDGVDVVTGRGFAGAFALQYGYAPRNLPARPYSIIQDQDAEKINKMILDYYTNGSWDKN